MIRVSAEERGFTLLELMAAGVPLLLIGLLLTSVFGFVAGFVARRDRQTDVLRQGRTALALLTRELRESSLRPDRFAAWDQDGDGSLDAMGFLVPRAAERPRPFLTDLTGMPQWEGAIFYLYDRGTRELRRVAAGPLSLSATPSNQKGSVVARRITRFHIERHEDMVLVSLDVGTPPDDTVLQAGVRPRN